MAGPVAGQEGHAAPVDLADLHRAAGRTVGRVQRDGLGVVEQRVQPRAAEHPDLHRLELSDVGHLGDYAGVLVVDEDDDPLSLPELVELPELVDESPPVDDEPDPESDDPEELEEPESDELDPAELDLEVDEVRLSVL